ncbi:MAG TPA: MBL fold metallo-hydrolase [Candidatus Acidoferrales bacterium]|nr:MBL fold metallo-hydrolase [Candidatus Acidoferrales bacterium]
MELREIDRDVYVCLQEDRGLGTSNSGFINSGGGVVVDTFWDLPHTGQLIDLYARVWPEPARRVINTHHNGDHCWGNQLFPQAEIIGHRLCAENFNKENPRELQRLRELADSPDPVLSQLGKAFAAWDFRDIVPTPPTTLVDDRMEIDLGPTRAELLYVGPAHTAGDLVVHLPESRIVFTGDILFRLCAPIGWEGTYERWIAALDRLVALEPAIVVPGHGPLCGVEGLRDLKAYLQYVRSESQRCFDAGLSVLEAAKTIDLGPYADWTEPERIYFNVARAYREFRGEAYDAPINVATMFRGVAEVRAARGKR